MRLRAHLPYFPVGFRVSSEELHAAGVDGRYKAKFEEEEEEEEEVLLVDAHYGATAERSVHACQDWEGCAVGTTAVVCR